MHIRELEIDNFKSCSGKVTIPFCEGFTAIAGPNGSGKSNIIDSILFCLGLSASRTTFRVESLKDFISWHNKREEASVRITFGDENNNEIMTVRREVKKTSAGYISTYQLNGKTSSLSEIHEQLLKYNVSPGSYNVLMQHEVTKITASSPLNRRKIIDEIAGVADFDRRIEQAEKELQTVEDRIEKSGIVLNEIDIRLDILKEQKEAALKYQKLREEKAKYENQKSTVKYFDIKNSLERVHENILETNKDKKQKEKELEKADKALEEAKSKLQELSNLVKQKGEDEQLKIKADIAAHQSSITSKESSIEMMEQQKAQNLEAIKNANFNIETLNGKIDDARLRIDNKNEEIKVLENNIEHEKAELEKVTKDIENVSSKSNESVKKRAELRAELDNKKDEQTNLLKDILPLENDISRYEKDIANAKEIIDEFDNTQNEKLSEKDKLDVKIEELQKELNDYVMMQKNTLTNLDNVKGKLDECYRNINLAVQKVTKLETQKQTMADFNFNRPVDFIMESKIRGVHAPLAKLGNVDEEFETALEIAMGARMASIVVDDEDVAGVCLDILKSANAGRATFLPLNKIKQAPDLRPPNINGVIDYAINLIDFDDKYYDAFYHALSDTLIVEDIGTAKKLIGKYRMVVLDGSLFDKSAAITGGSIPKSRMKFSSSENKELENCKKKLQEFQDEADRLDNKKRELENKLDTIRTDYSSATTELNKLTNTRDNLVQNLSTAQKTLEANKKIIEETTPLLNESKGKLDSLKKQEEKLKDKIENIQNEIAEVEKEIPEDEINKLDELSDAIHAEIERFRIDIISAQGEISNINNEIGFSEQSIKMQKDQIEKLKNANIDFDKNKKLTEEQISQIKVKVEELQEKVKEIDKNLAELQAQRDVVQNEVLEGQNQKNNLTLNLERIAENIEALKGRRKELEPELEQIRNELIEAGYQISSLQPVDISTEELEKAVARIDKKMAEMGDVNMVAIKEFDEISQRKEELKSKLDTLSTEKQEIQNRMQGYEDMKKKSFLDAYNKINENFQIICTKLFDGTGSLVLENPTDPLSGGLTITAQFRDKDEAKKLTGLSGGEKSLTALAFVFAIQRYLPAPFYALDESDASLDGINAMKLANMIKDQSKNTQFIVVSHHECMLESASRVIGITQGKGITKVTGIKLSD
ncbi:MAG: chromosome segregation protein SMC [bacterium]|nr:chromosome segregation protein SMC [bacterium]